jgi:predicted DNA-binding transcriptional regulator AlpA
MAAKAPPGFISKKQVVNLIGPSFWQRDEMIDAEDLDLWMATGKFPQPEWRIDGAYYWSRDEIKRWLKNPPADCKAKTRIAAMEQRLGGAA